MPVWSPYVTDGVDVTVGFGYTCVVRANGRVVCWGDNTNGQLGDGSVELRTSPVEVKDITQATQVSAGAMHSCAVLDDGKVACWGNNDVYQLGHRGEALQSITPTLVDGLTDAVYVSAGNGYTCALRENGKTVCWGNGVSGQLGNGVDRSATALPVEVLELEGAVDVRVTRTDGVVAHSCALRADDRLVCWGSNTHGQLGNGSERSIPLPVEVSSLDGVISFAVGGQHTCAVRESGKVYCWGDGANGRLGNESLGTQHLPVEVTGLTQAVEVVAGASHTCARRADGTVACWGLGDDGRLGYGAASSQSAPTDVADLDDAVSLGVGSMHTCAVRESGKVVCWGMGTSGQLGDGANEIKLVPTEVAELDDAVEVVAGLYHTCARRAGGTVACWGNSSAYGTLGTGEQFRSAPTPVALADLDGVVDLAAGQFHTCALRESGEVLCWGINSSGQIGVDEINASVFRASPTLVDTLPRDVVAIDAGQMTTCAVRDNGRVLCFGEGGQGQLGDGRPHWPMPVGVRWPAP